MRPNYYPGLRNVATLLFGMGWLYFLAACISLFLPFSGADVPLISGVVGMVCCLVCWVLLLGLAEICVAVRDIAVNSFKR